MFILSVLTENQRIFRKKISLSLPGATAMHAMFLEVATWLRVCFYSNKEWNNIKIGASWQVVWGDQLASCILWKALTDSNDSLNKIHENSYIAFQYISL